MFLSTVNTEMNTVFMDAELAAIGSRCGNYDPSKKDGLNYVPGNEVKFGNPMNEKGETLNARDKYLKARDKVNNLTEPSTCLQCAFFVRDSEMISEVGIASNGCRLLSITIKPGAAADSANGCKVGIMQNEFKEVGLGVLVDSIELAVSKHLVPPREIQFPEEDEEDADNQGNAERVLTDEEKSAGIVEWEEIKNPSQGGPSIFIPIFDPNVFDEEERSKIPNTGDDEHPENYVDHQNILYRAAAIWLGLSQTPALNGIPGVGKTEAFRYIAWKMRLPFERVSITNRTELDDLAGKMQVSPDKGTYFQYGRIPKAWNKPCVIVIDEPNVGPPDVWQFLRPLTDNSKQLVLDMNNGERISKNKFCFMGMAFNPTWDLRNVGTHEISDADGSRLMHISVPAPTEALERKIITEACKVDGYKIPDAILDSIMRIAKDIRELAPQDFPVHWGIRQQIKVARAAQYFSLKDCYRMAAADLLHPDDSEQIFQIVNANDASKIKAARPRKARF